MSIIFKCNCFRKTNIFCELQHTVGAKMYQSAMQTLKEMLKYFASIKTFHWSTEIKMTYKYMHDLATLNGKMRKNALSDNIVSFLLRNFNERNFSALLDKHENGADKKRRNHSHRLFETICSESREKLLRLMNVSRFQFTTITCKHSLESFLVRSDLNWCFLKYRGRDWKAHTAARHTLFFAE